jgi:translocation and assembly module TamB
MKRAAKVFAWSGGVLVALLVALAGAVCWVLFSTSGARWVAGVVTSRFVPQVSYASIDGTIAGELTVRDFRFAGAPDTAQVRIARLSVDPTLRMLFSRVVRIERAAVSGLVLTLPGKEKPQTDEPLWVEPPLDVVVRDFALHDGVVMKGRERLVSVKQLGVSARWSRDALVIERLELLPGDVAGEMSARGRIVPSGKTVSGHVDAAWRHVVVPARLAGRELATHGELVADGTPQKFSVSSQGEVGPPGDPTRFTLALHGTDEHAVIERMTLEQRAGRFAVTGDVGFAPVAWNLDVQAREFDPGAFLADWNGHVNLDLATRGEMRDAGPAGHLEIASLSGELRGRPLAGGGTLDFAAPSQVSGDVQLSSGRSRVAVRGESPGGQRIDATVDLAIASLNDWVPGAQGSLTGKFRVRGAWPKLTIAGAADGRSLGFADAKVATLHVDATVESPLDPAGEVRATARGIAAGGLEFRRATVDASGNQARHRVAARVEGPKLDASIAVSGGLNPKGWRGTLEQLKLASPDVANLALREPAAVSFESGAFSIAQTCLADGDKALCAAADVAADRSLTASYSFEHVPLGLAGTLAPDAVPGELRGELAGRGRVRRGVDGQWFGEARVTSPSARLVLADEGAGAALGAKAGAGSGADGAPPQPTELLLYENLDVGARLEGHTAHATLAAALDHGGRVDAQADASEITAAAPRIAARVDASMPTLAPFAAFAPGIGSLDGAVQAQIRLGGTTAAPEITGNVDATKLQADLGDLGIELREGALHGEARPGGGFALTGHVKSGAGRMDLEGTMTGRGAIDARIKGRNFVAADLPVANVVVTPDLTLKGDPKRYVLEGEVTIPKATIDIQKMPQDQPPGASPDVVVVRNGKVVERAEESSTLPLEATVTVKLGDKIAVTGYGLDATVLGQLVVHEAPGAQTTGSGTLDVSGRYKAYGQDLTIKDGKLLFAGTPLDNPRLAIVAMREISDDLSTGLRIAGSAQRPLITVISDPNVGEADALSYLVTGKSLNEVGSASGSSQDTLASATRSLEGAGAGLVAKRIGQRLGLDEATVEENEMIGGSALTIGEYLSPRLYLSYGVGLFEPGEVIALKYRLSKGVGVKIQRGSEETRAGVEYRIER